MDLKKILVVEDERKIADTLKIGLEENGFQAVAVYDAESAFPLMDQEQFNLVILDVNLPGISGFEFAKMIRKQNQDIPVILLTSMNTLENKVEGYEAGVDDYMVKPFEFKELVLKINVLLKRAGVNDTAVVKLRAGDLEMDLESKEVKRLGKPISLTAKEFQLLEFLLKNKNKVVSRSTIAMEVWDIDFDTNTNIIDVYISYLRNKIDKGFAQKLIHTMVGMGYVLKDP
jgi:two-component system, OmpR family, copper resistance phosphate regulon response regulator CusR